MCFFGAIDLTRFGLWGQDPRQGGNTLGWGFSFDTVTGNVGIGTGVGYPGYKLQVNGSVAGVGGYNNISDKRYKKNISAIDDPLKKVLQLRGITFDWRVEEFPSINFEKRRQVGFVAQEVEGVLPEAVSQGSDGYYSIAESKVVPLLVEAIKEQQKQIRAMRQELDLLKKTVNR